MDDAAQLQWMAQWRAASSALAEQRRSDLRSLTPEQAMAAVEALLALASPAQLGVERRTNSGLVEQQRLLHRRDSR